MNVWMIVGGLGLGVFVYAAVLFNRIVAMRNLTRNAWSDVDVYLKRRSELIPNLVASVQGYAAHESALFSRIAELRGQAQQSRGLTERSEREGELGEQVQKLMMVAESYPQLRANENFKELQIALSDTEDKIARARQYYNACIRDLNILVESFPSNILAGTMGQKAEPFFELSAASEAAAPKI